jgi:hypothetical protein
MSNPYLAVLATPPRESFGVAVGPAALVLLGFSAFTAALLNAYYLSVGGVEIRAEDAAEMIDQGKKSIAFPYDSARGALKQKAFNPAVSMAGAITKSAYMLGALSRQLKDRQFADVGEQILRRLNDDTSSKIAESDPEKIVLFYDQLMRDTISPRLAPYEKKGISPEAKYILAIIGQQGARDRVKSAQAQEEDRKAGAFELIDPDARARQDSCFETPEAREGHTKWEAMVPAFLREPDPKATPPGCKTRLKPWVAPTGIGVGVGLVALLLFRRRRPQQTVVMVPSSSSSAPAPAPANR